MASTQNDHKFPKYLFGAQGRALRNNVSLAGAFGFLLFGYDQGFLSVGPSSSVSISTDNARV
jgi:hypothetical protein